MNEKVKFNFPNLSSGYVGAPIDGAATLNSTFFSMLKSVNLKDSIVFPQRIPKIGFFEELCQLETPDFRNRLAQNKEELKKLFFARLPEDHKTHRVLNLAKILLRLGETSFSFEENVYDSKSTHSFSLRFVAACAEINKALSEGTAVNVSPLRELTKEAVRNNCEWSQLIPILSAYVAVTFRFTKENSEYKTANEAGEILDRMLRENVPQTFDQALSHSVGYRALAMDYTKGNRTQNLYIEKLKATISSQSPKGNLEKIVSLDNEFTSCQTLAKWEIQQGNLDEAEYFLRKLAEIDPLDSVGYSELALFLTKRDKLSEATAIFNKAASLGPPGVGMNIFFHAKTLRLSGDLPNAAAAFERAIEADPVALSPHLELIEIYELENRPSKVREISQYVLSNPCLVEQLEANEYETLSSHCKSTVSL